MQVIVMTSDNQYHCLMAFFHQWRKYFDAPADMVVCGFTPLTDLPYPVSFYSIGAFENYPPHKWSDALIDVLGSVADDVFLLLLEDYWLTRSTDTRAIQMMVDYMRQFEYVIKFDVTTDRLYAGGRQNYGTLGYLDLVKSAFGSPYHLSMWGGLWRRDLLRKVLVPGETAQQIELNGTGRLSQFGDEMLVLGTHQSPMKHANVIQGGQWNWNADASGLPMLTEADREELKERGWL